MVSAGCWLRICPISASVFPSRDRFFSLKAVRRKLQGFNKGEFGDLFKARVKNRGDDDELK